MTLHDSLALMKRELIEQPQTLAAARDAIFREAALIRPHKAETIWIGGCGDSLFAAQALSLYFRQQGWAVRPVSSAEMLWDVDIQPEDSVVGISMSGSTRRTVEAIRAASAIGAYTIAITLNSNSDLAQAATKTLSLPFVPISRAIPHGMDYHMTLLALIALAGDTLVTEPHVILADAGPKMMTETQAIAARVTSNTRFFFLGSGAALGSANYGAAKMHEAGGLSAWAFEAENFAHGAQFMLKKGDHVVLLGAGGRSDARTASLYTGFEKLGVSVSSAGLDTDDALSAAVLSGLHCQALCQSVAAAFELNVSDPANGSGADTVQSKWFSWTAS
ncbi:SIS domain-containing protein [Pacificibacter sp. AS14]|uniref:SIS domain-containing protein n=1 Tax=Alphaproteobacteria TaxID=28211 RepID=UPI003172F9E5